MLAFQKNQALFAICETIYLNIYITYYLLPITKGWCREVPFAIKTLFHFYCIVLSV